MSVQRVFDAPQADWIVQAPGREMWLAAVVGDEHEYTLTSEDAGGKARFSHRSAKTRQTVFKRPLPVWARYPAGVVARLGDGGLTLPGFKAVLLGDEPAGPRYAFGTGLVTAALCYELAGQPYTSEQLNDLVDTVRRQYIEG
jgi:galactokinase